MFAHCTIPGLEVLSKNACLLILITVMFLLLLLLVLIWE